MSTSSTGRRLPAVLSIAGLDPSGGAGVIADARAIGSAGAYATCIVTALTGQNTRGVQSLNPVGGQLLASQLDALLDDVAIDCTKTGILPNPGAVDAVADRRDRLGRLVIDPVCVSSSGTPLAADDTAAALISRLVPVCDLITPNTAEAERLSGIRVETPDEAALAAEAIHAMGAASVCVTGGHLSGEPVDVYCDAAGVKIIDQPAGRVPGRIHGTGCLFSALAAAFIATGSDTEAAVRAARQASHAAIANAVSPGGGMAVPWPRPA